MVREYRLRVERARAAGRPLPEFPEDLLLAHINNTWQDTASAVVGRWMGLVYQLTNVDRCKPFMDGVDPNNPLNLDTV